MRSCSTLSTCMVHCQIYLLMHCPGAGKEWMKSPVALLLAIALCSWSCVVGRICKREILVYTKQGNDDKRRQKVFSLFENWS